MYCILVLCHRVHEHIFMVSICELFKLSCTRDSLAGCLHPICCTVIRCKNYVHNVYLAFLWVPMCDCVNYTWWFQVLFVILMYLFAFIFVVFMWILCNKMCEVSPWFFALHRARFCTCPQHIGTAGIGCKDSPLFSNAMKNLYLHKDSVAQLWRDTCVQTHTLFWCTSVIVFSQFQWFDSCYKHEINVRSFSKQNTYSVANLRWQNFL